MRSLLFVAAAATVWAFAGFAQDAEDPFADIVEVRHGLMLQMAADASKLGAMAKGEVPFDAAVSDKAAANIAAIASVISMDQFPAGSEVEKAGDSFALPAIWTAQDDFLSKIADLNNAASMLAGATDAETLKGKLGQMGAACSACHKAYRQPEN